MKAKHIQPINPSNISLCIFCLQVYQVACSLVTEYLVVIVSLLSLQTLSTSLHSYFEGNLQKKGQNKVEDYIQKDLISSIYFFQIPTDI